MTFSDTVKDYLKNYNPGEYGLYRGKSSHILNIEGKNKKEVILKYNVLSEARKEPFLFDGKIHDGRKISLQADAHHLNSSQIMCYNFFRPLIEGSKNASENLIEIFKAFCPNLNYEKDAIGLFEYKQPGEKTSFDFYIQSGKTEIFCEIKYTENDFGKKCNASSPTHFEDVYVPLINRCTHLWKKEISEKGFMREHFQLFRNTIRSTDENKFVFFICPEDNNRLKKSYDCFKEENIKDCVSNVKYITWETLISHAREISLNVNTFEKKYFGYKSNN